MKNRKLIIIATAALLVAILTVGVLAVDLPFTSLFQNGFGGFTSDSGQILTNDFVSSQPVEVSAGDTVWFGPCDPTQYFHLVGADKDGKAVTDKIRGKDLEITDTFQNGSVIYKYEVPAGVEKLVFSAPAETADVYVVSSTEFGGVEWYAWCLSGNHVPENYVGECGIYTIETGKYIYFGAVTQEEASQAVAYDTDLKQIGVVKETDLRLVKELDNGYGIYCYCTTDSDVAYIRVSPDAKSEYTCVSLRSDAAMDAQAVETYFVKALPEVIYTNDGFNFTSELVWKTTKAVNQKVSAVDAWVKIPKSTREDRILTIAYCVADNVNYKMVVRAGKPQLSYIDSNGEPVSFIADVDLRTDKWTHIAWSWDETTGAVQCYINGKVSYTGENVGVAGKTAHIYVGGTDNFTWNHPFIGEIADVRMWAEPLTATEVRHSMNTAELGAVDGLVLNLPLDENTDAAGFRDLSANQNTVEIYELLRWLDNVESIDSAYSLVVCPDHQYLIERNPSKVNNLYDWIASIVEEENVQMVLNVGDFTNGNGTGQWERCRTAYDRIAGLVPFTLALGNHDYSYDSSQGYRDTTRANTYFPLSVFENMSTYGGAYEQGKMENTWQKFEVSGHKYLVLTLEFDPRNDVLEWASQVTAAHPDHQVIVLTHSYVNGSGTAHTTAGNYSFTDPNDRNGGDGMWEKFVSKHENIIMVISGHTGDNTGNIRYFTSTGEHGNKVIQFKINSQDIDDMFDGGIGMVALLRFSEDGQTVQVVYYCPSEGKYLNEENQFTFTVPAPSDVA